MAKARFWQWSYKRCLGIERSNKAAALGQRYPSGNQNRRVDAMQIAQKENWKDGRSEVKHQSNLLPMQRATEALTNKKPGLPGGRLIYRAMLSRSQIGSGNRGLLGGIAAQHQKRKKVGSGASGKTQPRGSVNLFCKPASKEEGCRLKSERRAIGNHPKTQKDTSFGKHKPSNCKAAKQLQTNSRKVKW